jgi:hypothetical protein
VRLVDQGLWSAAFFAFNLVAATLLDVTDFASLTVCSSIGVIIAAAVRAYAVDGRVIAGSRKMIRSEDSIERRSVVYAGFLGAVAASALSLGWLSAGGSLGDWWLPVVAGAIVLADGPHYSATMFGLYRRATYAACVYAALACFVLALHYFHFSAPVGLMWAASLCLVWGAGLYAFKPIPWASAPFVKSGVTLRLSGEALYSALGGQLGILIIFLTSPPDDTAGIRLAYSLVFAPIFMVIQGLSPLFLSRMAQLNISSRASQMRLLAKWASASAFGIVISGCIGAFLSLTVWKNTNFEHVMPFLLPVGAAMLGSLLLDSAMLQLRFKVDPKIPHRVRLVVVTVDAGLQLLLSITGGTSGLVWALLIGFIIKLAISVIMVFRMRNSSSAASSSMRS